MGKFTTDTGKDYQRLKPKVATHLQHRLRHMPGAFRRYRVERQVICSESKALGRVFATVTYDVLAPSSPVACRLADELKFEFERCRGFHSGKAY